MIFYFSATGNSKYVAERIAEETKDKIVSIVDCVDINDYCFKLENDESIGLVTPIYFLGLPIIVQQFLEKIDINESSYVYFVGTYGTFTGQISSFMKVITNNRLIFNALYSVKMPDTWTPIFDLSSKKKIAKINLKAEKQINDVVDKIVMKLKGDNTKNKLPRTFVHIFHKRYKTARKTKYFTVDSKCIGCGQCIRNCPSHAIQLENKIPVWIKSECIMCLGCLHRCPVFAIQYGKKTKKHGQYINPNIGKEKR